MTDTDLRALVERARHWVRLSEASPQPDVFSTAWAHTEIIRDLAAHPVPDEGCGCYTPSEHERRCSPDDAPAPSPSCRLTEDEGREIQKALNADWDDSELDTALAGRVILEGMSRLRVKPVRDGAVEVISKLLG